MPVAEEFTFFSEPRPAVIVASHERSGTHFLMNSIASCYGYVSLPWINFDMPDHKLLEHFSREQVAQILLSLAEKPMANIVKLHHAADIFAGQLERLTERYVILVIHRDPVAVMLSFWRYLHHFAASNKAGPLEPDPVSFARAKPFGRMMRYQLQEYETVIERWANHVEGWLEAATHNARIVSVRYEHLEERFSETMQSFAGVLGRLPHALIRPARDFNVIPPGPSDPLGSGIPPDLAALRSLCRERVGTTMDRLGY
jgi:hypothetical protein